MHIVITGADGFIGGQLARRIIRQPEALNCGETLERLSLIDLDFRDPPEADRVRVYKGSFADADMLAAVLADIPADMVFHLASVPSGMTENDPALGEEVNVLGTLRFLQRLRDQQNTPTVIFASSIAVYGKPAVAMMDETVLPTPNLSYGSHKVIGEVLVADYSRRNWINGCSLRIPGIVARPPEPNGAVSIFFSDLLRRLSHGQPFACPVSPAAKSWLMSVDCCVDNLITAANMGPSGKTTWTLPAMYVEIDELVRELGRLYPEHDMSQLISYAPDSWVEENFGSYPPIQCPDAERAGFKHDGDLETLIINSLKWGSDRGL